MLGNAGVKKVQMKEWKQCLKDEMNWLSSSGVPALAYKHIRMAYCAMRFAELEEKIENRTEAQDAKARI